MSCAWVLIREQPYYRRDAFVDGLRANGYDVRPFTEHPRTGRPGDVLVIWNRYFANHTLATQFEQDGGRVLVAENGYIGRGGVSPKFDVHPGGPKPGSYYAIAEGYHNGCGRWPDRRGGNWTEESETFGARLRALELPYREWRTGSDGYILVCPNRSFGVGAQVMPVDWAERTAARLQQITKREVRVRAHPGNDEPKRNPLSADLAGAFAVVIWSSSVGVHALVDGINVVCEAPGWILKSCCPSRLEDVELHLVGERTPALERMAWAQWTVSEIASGEPFRHLLGA